MDFQSQNIARLQSQSAQVEKRKKMEKSLLLLVLLSLLGLALTHTNGFGEQPLSKIAIHRTTLALNNNASVIVSPSLVGLKGEDTGLPLLFFQQEKSSSLYLLCNYNDGAFQ